jgi:transcriptional regulator with XRE-family HTH domain
MPNPNSRTEIGARLVLTRKALDYTQATMAGLMGVDGQTLAAYEAGRRRIPIKQALKLCPYGIRARLDLPWADGQPHPRPLPLLMVCELPNFVEHEGGRKLEKAPPKRG